MLEAFDDAAFVPLDPEALGVEAAGDVGSLRLRTNSLAVLFPAHSRVHVQRGVNQIVDLFPSLARTMQPLTRVASLLDSVPKIVSAAAPFPA